MTEPSCQREPAGHRAARAGSDRRTQGHRDAGLRPVLWPMCASSMHALPLSGVVRPQASFGRS